MRYFSLGKLFLLLLLGIFVGATMATPTLAARVDIGAGVTIEAPEGAQPVEGTARPIVRAWEYPSTGIAIQTILLPGAGEGAQELLDWPAVGRSLIQGFGKANIKTLGQSLNASCSYSGEPVARDLDRLLMRVRVTVRCDTTPNETVVSSEIISVITNSGQVVVRGSLRGGEPAALAPVVETIMRSLQVDPASKPALPAQASNQPAEAGAKYAPVVGGRGLRLIDYSLLRPAHLAGRFLGAFAFALFIGGGLCALARRLGVRPVPALLVVELALFAVATWLEGRDGSYEIDWLCRGVATIIAFFMLLLYFQRRTG